MAQEIRVAGALKNPTGWRVVQLGENPGDCGAGPDSSAGKNNDYNKNKDDVEDLSIWLMTFRDDCDCIGNAHFDYLMEMNFREVFQLVSGNLAILRKSVWLAGEFKMTAFLIKVNFDTFLGHRYQKKGRHRIPVAAFG